MASHDQDLLVNEIGSYSGQILLADEDAIDLVIDEVGGSWASAFSE